MIFFQHGRGLHFEDILRSFWEHFGGPLATFWFPLGSVGAPLVPFVVPFAPWWDSLRSLRPLLVAFGLLFVPFGHCILVGFYGIFQRFKRIFPCLAVTGGIPSFLLMILNERSARASEASRARSSSSNPRLEAVIAYSFREWHGKRFKLLMLIRAPAKVYF